MNIGNQQADNLIRQGLTALQQGRMADARSALEAVTGAGSTNGFAWLLLAVARGGGNDEEGKEQALNRLLELEPDSVRGHVMKGDCRAAAGDLQAAIYFYRSAVALAQGRELPAEVVEEVRRGAEALRQLQERGYASREKKLVERGLPPKGWSPRFRQSLELAAGRKRLYLQQPTAYNYPGLPHLQFYDPAEFEWTAAVEAATPAIREELTELLRTQGTEDFRAYIQHEAGAVRLDQNKELVGNKDWSVLLLCENGKLDPKVVEQCPRTWEAMQDAPLPSVPGWGPTVLFSLLKPGARIAPHTGMFNTRLICHLPLIVPPNCRFRVGNDIREWEVGKLMIFDDTIEHEAWNDSDQDRVVLIFDIWRPELSEQERKELTALFGN